VRPPTNTTDLIEEKLAVLTPQERRIFTLILHGLSAKRIAAELQISSRTVERHTGSIYDKLGVRSRIKLAAFALSIDWYRTNLNFKKEERNSAR
jgi:DNA-binding NarL/FixJ family response regulator